MEITKTKQEMIVYLGHCKVCEKEITGFTFKQCKNNLETHLRTHEKKLEEALDDID